MKEKHRPLKEFVHDVCGLTMFSLIVSDVAAYAATSLIIMKNS